MADFCHVVRKVLDDLPAHFLPWLENVVVDVEREPTDEMLEDLGLESPADLLGLFVGVGIDEQEYGIHVPNRVILFKRPLERASRSRAELEYEIRRTVLHELAHHFGHSEADLADFESQPSPFDEE